MKHIASYVLATLVKRNSAYSFHLVMNESLHLGRVYNINTLQYNWWIELCS